jgi:predicted nucleic acid-binding protein
VVIYFDTSYLVRLYVEDRGFASVRSLAAIEHVASSLHGKAEVVAALHRCLREGRLNPRQFRTTLNEFLENDRDGAFRWLAIEEAAVDILAKAYAKLPGDVFLRAADALHLACAVHNGFREVFSNDHRFLDAARHFGLKGKNVITA